ncbi:ArnT family glycosyltransferase [Phytohabitans flavus]|uniref:ArnT family glycosyltransferase n=1 Tax=Phytohabitans flavus TaxID=1076124 RepID=UPI001565A3E6|nr:glycosyltransferase family 39 protein [Phytohabitans flavus]
MARNYAERGIDLLHTPLTVFGEGSDVPMEFPLVQAVAALLVRLGLSADVAMRLVGLVSFQAAALLLFALALRWHGRRVAVIAVVLLEFSPFTMLWGAASLIEFPTVALALAMVLGLDHWFAGGRWWWLAAGAVSGALAFLVKVTTMPAFMLLLAGSGAAVIFQQGLRQSWRRVLVGGAAAVVPGLALAAVWTVYADHIKAGNPATAFLTSSALRDWNFGTLEQRLDITSYATIMQRITDEIVGPHALTLFAGLAAVALGLTLADRIRGLAWVGAVIVTPLLFFNLYVRHSYYLCAIVPAVAMLAALGLDGVARLARDRTHQAIVAGVATLFVLANSAISPLGRNDIKEWRTEPPPPEAASVLAAHTDPGSKIILIGCDWSPVLPYFSHRDAVMFRRADGREYWEHAGDVTDYGWLYACKDADPRPYLPPGAAATPSGQPSLWRVTHAG